MIEQDYNKGFKWILKSAKSGVSNAQIAVGLMYKEGKGTPINKTMAYMWLYITLLNDTEYAKDIKETCDILAKDMERSQIEEAKAMAKQWVKEHHVK